MPARNIVPRNLTIPRGIIHSHKLLLFSSRRRTAAVVAVRLRCRIQHNNYSSRLTPLMDIPTITTRTHPRWSKNRACVNARKIARANVAKAAYKHVHRAERNKLQRHKTREGGASECDDNIRIQIRRDARRKCEA